MNSLFELSDLELISNFRELVFGEREQLVAQLDYIAELDRRKLFLHHSSLYSYLIHEYGMEEWTAERKIRAARVMQKISAVREKLLSGKLNMPLIEIVHGYAQREKLQGSEFVELLDLVGGKSCNAAKRELAGRFPESPEIYPDRIRPINGELSEVRFVAHQELLDKLEDIRGMLAHSHPNLKIAELIDLLATEFRERHHPEEKARRAMEKKQKQSGGVELPSSKKVEDSRRVPTALTHELTYHEGYQCSFVDPITGQGCESQFRLEKDHVFAWSKGGKTELSNLRYLCAAHHQRVSYLEFGEFQSKLDKVSEKLGIGGAVE